MEKFKGTKRKWQVVDDYDNYVPYSSDTPQIYIWDGDEQSSKPICDMGEMGDFNYAEELANAHLIAAAPDLLEALQLLLRGWNNPDINHDVTEAFNIAQKSVDKALNI